MFAKRRQYSQLYGLQVMLEIGEWNELPIVKTMFVSISLIIDGLILISR